MPQGYIFNQADFDQFMVIMLMLGFKLMKPKPGRQEGFEYFKNGLRVIVWTTFVTNEGRTREEGSGKVITLESNRVVYMGTFKNRTKFFFENLFIYALAAKERVDHRPYSKCHKLMNIYQGEKKQKKDAEEEKSISKRTCFWVCPVKSHRHKGGCPTKSWSLGLSDEVLSVMVKKWDRASKYYDQLRAKGKKVNVFLTIRKSWEEKFGEYTESEEAA